MANLFKSKKFKIDKIKLISEYKGHDIKNLEQH